jgi:general L-amino acid transport system permease protein
MRMPTRCLISVDRYIIGLFDLLGIVQAGVTDPNWLAPTVTRTGYAFAAIGFWILCFALSRYSIHLEGRLHRGHRRN